MTTVNQSQYSAGFASGMLHDAIDPLCVKLLAELQDVIKHSTEDVSVKTSDFAYAHGYRDGMTESHTLTLEQAKNLYHGQTLYQIGKFNSDGTPKRWRVSSQIKTWKRNAGRVEFSVKYGMYCNDRVTQNDLHLLTASEEYAKQLAPVKPVKKLVKRYVSCEDEQGVMVEVNA